MARPSKYKEDLEEVKGIIDSIIDIVGFEQFILFADSFEKSIKYIYVIKMNRHRYYKIGIATNVEQRLKMLQTGNPEKLSIVYKKEFANCTGLEKALHKKYNKYKMVGEWFSLTKELRDDLLETLNKVRIFNGKNI